VLALLLATAVAAPFPCGLPLLGAPPPLRAPSLAPPSATLEERDAFGSFPNEARSQHFVLKWGDTGGVTGDDASAVLDAFEDAWAVEIDEMGHPEPTGSDQWLFNVYVGDTSSGTPSGYGAAGYFYVDSEGYPYVVIARDTLYDADYAAITAAHEFYHALQDTLGTYAYTGRAAWYWEATAEWAAGEVYPDNDYSAVFLLGLAYLPYLPVYFFDYPDSGLLQEYHQYGAFIFPRYLSEEVADWSIVRDSWVLGGDDDPLAVIDGLLAERGTSVAEVFPAFAAHNAVWDYQYGERYQASLDAYEAWYGSQDEHVAARLPAAGTGGWKNAPEATLPYRYGYNLLELDRPQAGTLVFGFNGDAQGSLGGDASWGVTLVTDGPDGVRYTAVPLDEDEGTASLILSGEEDVVYAAVAAIPADADDAEVFGYSYEARWEDADSGAGEDSGGGDSGGGRTFVSDEGGCGCSSAPGRRLGWPLLPLVMACLYRRSTGSAALRGPPPGGPGSGPARRLLRRSGAPRP